MKIGILSRESGVSTYTIRYYEKMGLINKPTKDASGHRIYDANDLDMLNWVNCLKKSGMSLEKIKTYVKAGSSDNQQIQIEILKTHLVKLKEQQTDIQHYINVTLQKIKSLKKT